ncbi:MAG: hypothetical protein HY951_16295 [Bacteroidia bacterium]|nr:hypothetical protein [Bacteroidia bacterium]
MRVIILSLFLLISFVTFSQPAGYLGKRFTVSFEALAGPNYLNIVGLTNLHNRSYNYQGASNKTSVSEANANFNFNGALTIDYVVGKTKSRGISIGPIDQTMYFDDYNMDTVYGNATQVFFVNNAKLSGFNVGAYVKYFKKQQVAPLGEYYKFELIYSNVMVKSIDKKAEIYKQSKAKFDPISTFGFAVTYGKNRIFWDKVVLSAGITLGARLNFFSTPFISTFAGESYYADNELKKAVGFWHGQNLFYNLHLGVGILLF